MNKGWLYFHNYNLRHVCHVKIEITEQMDKTIRKLIAVLQKIGNWSAPKGATGANTAQTLVDKLSAFLLPEENEEGMEEFLIIKKTQITNNRDNILWRLIKDITAISSLVVIEKIVTYFYILCHVHFLIIPIPFNERSEVCPFRIKIGLYFQY